MKVRKKRISIIFVIALLMIFSSTMVSADTTHFTRPRINGSYGEGRSSIYHDNAYASTSYGKTGSSISVSSTYYFIKTSSNTMQTMTGSNGGQSGVRSVTFGAPRGCESYQIRSTHRISSGGEKWSGTTSPKY